MLEKKGGNRRSHEKGCRTEKDIKNETEHYNKNHKELNQDEEITMTGFGCRK